MCCRQKLKHWVPSPVHGAEWVPSVGELVRDMLQGPGNQIDICHRLHVIGSSSPCDFQSDSVCVCIAFTRSYFAIFLAILRLSQRQHFCAQSSGQKGGHRGHTALPLAPTSPWKLTGIRGGYAVRGWGILGAFAPRRHAWAAPAPQTLLQRFPPPHNMESRGVER